MIAQVASASLVSENKVLCHPASVDSIPSSAGREDHVSMGSISARKLRAGGRQREERARDRDHDRRRRRRSARAALPSRGVAAAHAAVRRGRRADDRRSPALPDIAAVAGLVAGGNLVLAAESAVGPLS